VQTGLLAPLQTAVQTATVRAVVVRALPEAVERTAALKAWPPARSKRSGRDPP
jgi:hypothetical protein